MHITIAPDVQLFVDIDGAGLVIDGSQTRQKPSLLLLHGGPGFDHLGFKPYFDALTDMAQVIYYDHRGHGRSTPRPMAEITLDTLADDVVRLCTALGIERPIVLGQSFGGFVAQRYLARHPGHAARVILSSTSPHMALSRKLAVFERLGGTQARDIAERFWVTPNVATYAEYNRVCKPLYSAVQPPADAPPRPGMVNADILFHWASTEQQTMDLLPGLAHAQCPVLVMAGGQDPVCPLEDSLDIAAALPRDRVELAVFEHCGHGVWRDDVPAGLARIRAFIAGADDQPAA